jgi:ABC-type antimicrobial peptide transport system permease subunit
VAQPDVEMSRFKVAMVAGAFALVLLQLTILLSYVFRSSFLVSVLIMCIVPVLAISMGHLRSSQHEAKLWNAIALAGFLAPLSWLLALMILLTRSRI